MNLAFSPAILGARLGRLQPVLATLGSWGTGLGVLLGLAVLALGIAAGWHWRRRQQMDTLHDPRRLFRELCLAHGLSAPQQRLLWRVARQLRLAQPALLFVHPSLLEGANENTSLADERATLATIHKTLFATSAAPTPARMPRRSPRSHVE